MQNLFDRYINDIRYLENKAESTIALYKRQFKKWQNFAGEECPSDQKLKDFVISLRQAGLAPGTVNAIAICLNSFLKWYAEETDTVRLHIKKLPDAKKHLETMGESELTQILTYKTDDFVFRRVQTLIVFLIETGCRINEALTLTIANCDLDRSRIKVLGKGNKERVIPISVSLRRILQKYIQGRGDNGLVFATKQGKKINYQNIRMDFYDLCTLLRIDRYKFDGCFHSFRRQFARHYLKIGGNLVYLQTILGHNDIQTTRRYLGEIESSELVSSMQSASLVSKLT
jgi:site-specific recombinase XerD